MSLDQGPSRYVSFWGSVGASFPSLKGAMSTQYYFECERMLFERFLPELRDLLLLKTDLWNEAKHTEILRWAGEQGAHTVGIDIAFNIAQQAREVLGANRNGCLVADVRSLPFPTATFDLIYSMGTIEHFPDYKIAVLELFRTLKPGGSAIIGVPNKLDPFLRPLLVGLLNPAGLYPFGREKSFTPRQLRRLLESAGFQTRAQTGIFFMPGWLRMLDLWCHTRLPRFAPLTGWLVRPFAWLYRRVPMVRRHGYLIACIVGKPSGVGLTSPPGHPGPAG